MSFRQSKCSIVNKLEIELSELPIGNFIVGPFHIENGPIFVKMVARPF